MRRASVLMMAVCAVACAPGPKLAGVSALGWSLGGEAHVFVTGHRFAADLYSLLTAGQAGRLRDTLARRALVAIAAPPGRHGAAVLFPTGAAPGTLTLARFHAPGACGRPDAVTELIFAFAPASPRGTRFPLPPPHVTVVAVLAARAPHGGDAAAGPPLSPYAARQLVARVAQAAERAGGARPPPVPLAAVTLDADRAADAGEVLPLPTGADGAGGRHRYAVGFRVRFRTPAGDTVLTTGIADTDTSLRTLRWVVPPLRARLVAGMMRDVRPGETDARRRGASVRYSLRGMVAGLRAAAPLLLVNEIADVAARDSRATVVDTRSRRVVAAQPLALRCP